jgi:hypothetical protein
LARPIIFTSGSLVIRDRFITRNTAFVGGGIYHTGALTLTDTPVVTENTPDNFFP